jgi:hypothetical protein
VAIEDVPTPQDEELYSLEAYQPYWKRLNNWLVVRYGMCLYSFKPPEDPHAHNLMGYMIKVIEGGFAPNGYQNQHAVVMLDGLTIWDPSVESPYGDGEALFYIVFRAFNPAIVTINYDKLHGEP